VGYGVTGRSVSRYLVEAGDQVVIWDDRAGLDTGPEPVEAAALLSRTPSPDLLDTAMSEFVLVVPSPGVAPDHPVLSAAARLGISVRSEIDLAFELPEERRPAVVAITGTNGKTTVTTLAEAMLNRSGVSAVAAGNIGLPLLDAIRSDVAVVVAEVSSFQLHFTERFHPVVSCWLNLSDDHLDWHPSHEHYTISKSKIWARQGPGDCAVVNADESAVLTSAESIPTGVKVVRFSIEREADYCIADGTLVGPAGDPIVSASELPRAFPHDLSNSLAAAAVAFSAGATSQGCRSALRDIGPLPHRVALVGSSGGVNWYDDSKATTPASVQAAMAGFASVVLIAGGRNKGLDLAVLGNLVPPVRAVVAIGEAAPEVASAFAGKVEVATATSMEDACQAAADLARLGDAVVLSPGCASFDWYRSYAERGDHFASIVRRRFIVKEGRC
jgi:UDP-N-acetylmuramoylalanine--D-glutamate ligase